VITQDSILNLIRKQEADIQTLLETKKKAEPGDIVHIVTERVVLERQQFISQLRGLI
jgi:hypothetical protein